MMSKKSFAILAVITLIIGAAAWYLTEQRLPKTELVKRPLYPELLNRVNDIARIEVKTKDQDTVLAKQGEQWVIENRSRYPALFEKVKGAVLAIADLEILEGKTKNKELYPRLGVEDIETQGASSRQVMLLDQGGQPLAALIVGKKRSATSGRGMPAFYVRKAGEPQALLVKGALEIPEKPIDWADQSLLNIDAKRIREITIEPPGQGPLRIYRKDASTQDFTLDNILKGTKLKSQTTLNGLASTLEFLRFEDVVARASFTPPPNPTVTTLRTFDGLIAKVTTANLNDKAHASFEFAYDAQAATAQAKETPADKATKPSADAAAKPAASNQPTTAETPKRDAKPSVEEEAAKLNEKTRDWVYIVPAYKATLLTKTLSDLTAPETKAEDTKKEGEPQANKGVHPKSPAETSSPPAENSPSGP